MLPSALRGAPFLAAFLCGLARFPSVSTSPLFAIPSLTSPFTTPSLRPSSPIVPMPPPPPPTAFLSLSLLPSVLPLVSADRLSGRLRRLVSLSADDDPAAAASGVAAVAFGVPAATVAVVPAAVDAAATTNPAGPATAISDDAVPAAAPAVSAGADAGATAASLNPFPITAQSVSPSETPPNTGINPFPITGSMSGKRFNCSAAAAARGPETLASDEEASWMERCCASECSVS